MSHTITIYRSERAIFAMPVSRAEAGPFGRSAIFIDRPPDVPLVRFDVFEFSPRPAMSDEGSSFRRLRMASVPIRVESSLPVVLVGEGRKARLSVWWSPKGIDAAAVYHVARAGEKGMRIVDGSRDENRVVSSHVQPVDRVLEGLPGL